MNVRELRNKKENVYHWLMMVIGAILWLAIAQLVWDYWDHPRFGATVRMYFGYAVAFVVFRLVAGVMYRAIAFGNMVLLGPSQFPEIYAMVEAGAKEIGLSEPPKTFIYNSNGLFNAFARRILGSRYVFLTSALVQANNDAQVRFVIGHEIGHHAAGHLNPWLNFIKLPAHIVPFLGKAYSRAREYTCDSIGAYLSKDAHASRRALQMLGCGCQRLNDSMNCEAFVAQEDSVPEIAGFIVEICRTHPRLTRRVSAINAWSKYAGDGEPTFDMTLPAAQR
ncbi:peptidase [Burkholderia sp. MSh2]|uniref:Zn-dependent protease n=1 Tax=Burkholderia paludis TaxID=1506587 RepID=A0A6J5EUH7_9BURK|nr:MULTISPECIES: M48 family metallopeptidase [Burkholderia]KEZ02702.1 peptidase [Burkholderia sp. MSh2]CAB3770200.1 Protease HtpX [Burkholderia paludis]VWB92452.1 Zn-dependent protease [Burkholderia paludis]